MRGIVVPERTEDFTADPVELTFDLAFVFAFSRLVSLLVHDPTAAGVLDAGLLFLLLWLPWTQFTWAANAVAGNQRVVRLLFLAATTASIPMAAGVTTAFDDGGSVFAVSLGSIHLVALATMALGLERGTAERSSTIRYAAPNAVAVAVVVSGSFLAGDGRRLAWLAAIGIVLFATMLAGNGDWIIRSGHFAERHGLIVIVALGEVIVAIGVPVATALEEGHGLSGMTVTALVAAGVFAGIVWWSYFDRPQPALEHHAAQLDERDRPRFSRDAYTYAHAPLVAGVILAAAGLEEITLHPGDPTPWAFRLMLVGGIGLIGLSVAAAVRRAYRIVAVERLGALVAVTLIAALAEGWDGVVMLIAIDAALLVTLVSEHVRLEAD